MKRKIIALCLIVAMLGVAVIGGTMAYFTDTAEAVNVMTIGSVKIEQIEKEWKDGALVDYTQAKPLLPYVGDLGWANTTADDGAFRTFTMNNVVDKIVQVENTGRSDAYVRTIFAFEVGEYTKTADLWYKVLGISNNAYNGAEFKFDGTWEWSDKTDDDMIVEINGNNYIIVTATHLNAVKPGETTIPSLLQIYMSKDAKQEDAAKLDGNKNGTYDILVISQAIQANGFNDAKTALNAGFEEVTAANAKEWFNELIIPTVVETADELKAALAKGGSIILAADIDDWDADATVTVPAGKTVNLDLNGNTITAEAKGTGNREIFLVKGDMTVTNGTIDLTATVDQGWSAMATAFDVTAGGVLNLDGVTIDVSGTSMAFCVHLNNWGEVTLNAENTTFKSSYIAVRAFNSGYDMNNITIKNSTLEGKYGFWVHNYTAADFGTQEKADAQAKLLNLDVFNGTNTFNVIKNPGILGFTNEILLNEAGQPIA